MTASSSTKNWMFIAADTMTRLESEIQRSWSWQLPSSGQPRVHVAPEPPVVIAPHIHKRGQKVFRGHLFRIGGSKK